MQEVSLNELLSSTTWTAPPTDMVGIDPTSERYACTVSGRTKYGFASHAEPHPWPAQYTITTEFPIVGLGVMGQTLVVLTQILMHELRVSVRAIYLSLNWLASSIAHRAAASFTPGGAFTFRHHPDLSLFQAQAFSMSPKSLSGKINGLNTLEPQRYARYTQQYAYYGFGSARVLACSTLTRLIMTPSPKRLCLRRSLRASLSTRHSPLRSIF